jgi:flagellar biosynthesis/type III secretory pathway M-ring protein FliF/YscJ
MEYGIAAIVLAALVAIVVLRPLSRGEAAEAAEAAEREELEAAKEAKYREIRDAELDHRMGKLSEADWKAVDRDLRAEAMEILRRLDRLEGRMPEVERRASGR